MEELDKLSLKILRELYKGSLSQAKFNQIIGRADMDQPNEIESFLLRENLIRVKIVGMKDGEGGIDQATASRSYFIQRRGKAVVELANKDRLSSILNLLPHIPSL